VDSSDKLSIDTPELIALELPLAGIGSRFLAFAIDSLLQTGASIIVLLTTKALSMWLGDLFNAIGATASILTAFCLYWGYFAFFEILWSGQTPGKRLVGIRVIKESGRPITALEGISRNVLRALDMLPVFYAVGLICMISNKRNKRVGDFVAGTVLVHDKKMESVSAVWNPGGLSSSVNLQSSKISPEMLLLIETYLNRRYELDASVRIKTAQQIASAIVDKTGVEREEGESDDAFLEAVARKVRDTARYR
jgi:uncharacterized RDD family membrane protein YckC